MKLAILLCGLILAACSGSPSTNDRLAAALQTIGQGMFVMGAPQPRTMVTCNTFGRTTTCY